jgi:hypothetical protein
MKPAIAVVGLFVSVLAIAGDGLLTHYPQIDSEIIQSHLDKDRHKKWGYILGTTEFVFGDFKRTQHCVVSADGRVEEYSSYEMGTGGSGTLRLSTNTFRKVVELIERLPEGRELPSPTNLLIVSYARGTNWMTSTYDLTHLPDEVKTVFETCGCGLGYGPNGFIVPRSAQRPDQER